MKKIVTILLVSSVILSGCATPDNASENKWKVTEEFSATPPSDAKKPTVNLIGKKDQLAFIANDQITANELYNTKWFFWDKTLQGTDEERLKLIGIQKLGGKKEKILYEKNSKVWATNNWEKTIPSNNRPSLTEKLEASVAQPITMSFPSPGLWRLKAYIGDKLYGTITVNVQTRTEANK